MGELPGSLFAVPGRGDASPGGGEDGPANDGLWGVGAEAWAVNSSSVDSDDLGIISLY